MSEPDTLFPKHGLCILFKRLLVLHRGVGPH